MKKQFFWEDIFDHFVSFSTPPFCQKKIRVTKMSASLTLSDFVLYSVVKKTLLTIKPENIIQFVSDAQPATLFCFF